MDDIQKIDDHSDNLSLIVEQYKKSTNLKGMIDAMNDLADQLENALFEIRDLFYLETAEGVQLDVIGSIFGVDREGDNDTDYKVRIKAKSSLIGSGEPEFIIRVLKDIFGATFVDYFTSIFPSPPATYYVLTDAVITTTQLKIFSPAGVQPNILFPLEFEDGTKIEFEDSTFLHAVE